MKPTIVTSALLPKLRRMAKNNPDMLFWAFKFTMGDGQSPYYADRRPFLICKKGAVLAVKHANIKDRKDCGAGVNVATASWVNDVMHSNNRLMPKAWVVQFRGRDLAATPYGWRYDYIIQTKKVRTYRGKFRLFRGTVVKRITAATLKKHAYHPEESSL